MLAHLRSQGRPVTPQFLSCGPVIAPEAPAWGTRGWNGECHGKLVPWKGERQAMRTPARS